VGGEKALDALADVGRSRHRIVAVGLGERAGPDTRLRPALFQFLQRAGVECVL
jgi:hypothetical protein